MITELAREIKLKLEKTEPWDVVERGDLVDQLCREIVDNCKPTRSEFVELVDWYVLPNWFWWDLMAIKASSDYEEKPGEL